MRLCFCHSQRAAMVISTRIYMRSISEKRCYLYKQFILYYSVYIFHTSIKNKKLIETSSSTAYISNCLNAIYNHLKCNEKNDVLRENIKMINEKNSMLNMNGVANFDIVDRTRISISSSFEMYVMPLIDWNQTL